MTEPETQNVYVRGVPSDLWRRLKAAAALRSCRPSDLVIEAVTHWLRTWEKPTEWLTKEDA